MNHSDRREAIAWAVAAVAVVVDAIATAIGLLTPVSSVWFAYQPLASATFVPGGDSVIVSQTAAIGLAVLTLGLLVLMSGRVVGNVGDQGTARIGVPPASP